jgi:secreted PhoX family phosphatase
MNRRDFLEFIGHTGAAGAALTFMPEFSMAELLTSSRRFRGIAPSAADDLILAPGLKSQVLIKWGDPLDALGDLRFGFNNDFTAFIPLNGRADEGLLWVNHENINPLFVNGVVSPHKSLGEVESEMRSVGGSVVHIKLLNDQWEVVFDSAYNRRLDAFTPIPFAWPEPIDGLTTAYGTLANCAGGVTPWGHILTCEENYPVAFGEYRYTPSGRQLVTDPAGDQWQVYFGRSPEQYGWVVEVNPQTGAAKKLVALGRFAHEGATTVKAADGRCVVYMGDDAVGECIYKFISSRPGSLDEGELFVADTLNGRWLSLDIKKNSELRKHFASQTEVLIRTREAARIVGGTPQDRPEDIKIDPITGAVIVALTNNTLKHNLFGGLLRIDEENNDPLALNFHCSVLLMGGVSSGFACPDNMVFDRFGNLWVTSDIATNMLGKGDYAPFLNNGLFVIPTSGRSAGVPIQVASAPVEAELTGPSFSPDGKTLFLSVQHPGEQSRSTSHPTSRWPLGGIQIPRPAVVAIRGPLFDNISKLISPRE